MFSFKVVHGISTKKYAYNARVCGINFVERPKIVIKFLLFSEFNRSMFANETFLSCGIFYLFYTRKGESNSWSWTEDSRFVE